MVDSSVTSIISAIFLDLIVFCILFSVFFFYRKIRSPVFNTESEITLKKSFYHEGEYDLTPLIKKVYSMPLTSVYSNLGEWGYVYLTLHKYIIYVLSLYCLIALPVLLVIYSLGSSDSDVDSSKIGISHVIDNENYLIAPIVFIFVFSAFIAAFLYFYFSAATEAHIEELSQPHRSVVKITKIPGNFPPEFINYKIKKLLMTRHAKEVTKIYTIPNYQVSYKNYLKLQNLNEDLKTLFYKERETGKRPTRLNMRLKRVDEIEYTEEKIRVLEGAIEESKEQGMYFNSGKAFVICKNEKRAKQIIELHIGNDEVLKTSEWKFKTSSHPHDIAWHNIGSKTKSSLLSKVLYNALFIFLFLMILTPSTFNYLIIGLVESIGGGQILKGIVGVYLPSLLLLVYQQVILPEAVEFLVALEKHSYKHDEISSGLRKYLFYLVFYTFLYPLLGLKFIELIKLFFNDSIDWEEEFANSINENGQFFTVLLIHECFIKNAWDLMVTGKYFKAKARELIATSEEEKALAYQAEDFKFDLELAISMNIFIMVSSFGVVYPLIVVPGLGFFALRVRAI